MNQKFWHEDKPGHINQDLETNKLKSVDSKQQRLSNRRMSKKEKKYSKLSTSREYLNPFACQTSPAFCLFLENKHKARGIPEPGHLREYHSQVQILHQEPSPIGYPHYPGPYQNHPVYHTPHGPVTVTVFNGTTYYHHQKNFETLLSGKVLYETDNPTSMCSNCGSSLPRERKPSFFPSALNASCSSTPHNNSCSIASHSGSSSRSSTPPSSYFGSSASARDSGLVSNTSTDDDASLIQESSYAELREEKLLREIKDAAEELMSDEYLTKNSYLLRQIKRNPEGYISIKLLACLKKIKKLTKSHHLLVLALKSSKELKMNDTNTKVKRSQPVSNQLMPKKETASLILIDPSDINGIEDIDRKFKKYGHLSQVQIVRPGRALPPHLKGYANAIPQLGEVMHDAFLLQICAEYFT